MSNLCVSLLLVPERRHNLGPTLAAMQGADRVLVFEDKDHNGFWWNTLRAWYYPYPTETTHVMFVQDDLYFCRDYLAGVRRLIEKWPDQIIAPYTPGPPVSALRGTVWLSTYQYGGQCQVWPVSLLRRFLAWQKAHSDQAYDQSGGDDARMRTWTILRDHLVVLPAYSLCYHDHNMFQSTFGHRTTRGSGFLDQRSALDVEWELGNPPTVTRAKQLPRFILRILRGDFYSTEAEEPCG